jgi:UDP-N-acetylmuramyl pentapeptide phosphotransferase/UDP-N-acetylglucosamine-1-phosphate transferase
MSAQIVLVLLIFFNLILFLNFESITKLIKIYDYPDKIRKFHKKPIPLLGGFFLYFTFLIIFIINFFFNEDYFNLIGFNNKDFLIFFCFSSIIFFLFLLDDLKNLSANLKLFLLILILFIYLTLDSNLIITELRFKFLEEIIILKYFSIPFTLLSFLLFINAFNMFDGINLQSGIYSLLIFFVLFAFNHNLAILFFIIPILFFLILNYKNNCFLGNNGSSLLSFIISVLVIKIYNYNKVIFADDIFLLMCIPGYDLFRLAFIRLINKKHPFYPDRNHLHHLLISSCGTNLTVWIIQFAIIAPNILNYFTNISSILIIILSLFFYSFLLFYKKIQKKSVN